MKPDPIVAEVRAVRDRLAARFNYDIDPRLPYRCCTFSPPGRALLPGVRSSVQSVADSCRIGPHLRAASAEQYRRNECRDESCAGRGAWSAGEWVVPRGQIEAVQTPLIWHDDEA